MKRSPQFYEGFRNAAKGAVSWLHARANSMNDPHAQSILNLAADEIGRHFRRVSADHPDDGSWRDMSAAPKDGTWVILDCEVGGHMWEPRVGRWNPRANFGVTYEWEVVERYATDFDSPYEPDDIFTNYASPEGWRPLL